MPRFVLKEIMNLNFQNNSLVINPLTTIRFSKRDSLSKDSLNFKPVYLHNVNDSDLNFGFNREKLFLWKVHSFWACECHMTLWQGTLHPSTSV